MNMIPYSVMVGITLFSMLAAGIAVFILIKSGALRELTGGYYIKVKPKLRKEIKESMEKRFAIVHSIYEHLYYTCNNHPKDKDKLADYLEQEYLSGGIREISNDIVYMADMAEGGAISKMASEFGLSSAEIRTCCYIHAGFKWQQTCTAENLTENAYNVRCSRIRKKLSLEKEERIPDFIASYCSRHTNSSGQ